MASEANTPASAGQASPAAQPAEKRLSSRYRGVCWNKKNNRWQSAINRGGKYIYLGSFVEELEAAKAFDRAAVKLRGQAAKINFAFTDYPAEMSWHKMVMARAENPDTYLSNPKILREKVDMTVPSMPDPFLAMPFSATGTGFRPTLQPFPMIQRLEPLRGRVVTQPQEGGSRSMYHYPLAEGLPIDKPTAVASSAYPSNMMFPTSAAIPFPSVGIPLSEPVVKAEPAVTPEQASVIEQWLPLANNSKGSEVTLLKGHQNSFVMTFMREDTTDTEVLLYDGQMMHEVGPFHSQEAAMQTSHFLLDFVNKFKSGESGRNRRSGSGERSGDSDEPTVVQLHEEIENENGAAIAESLEGKSPFEVAEGCHPTFYPEDTEEDKQATAEYTIPISEETDPKAVHYEDGITDSFKHRMGSLLVSSLSFGSLNDPPQPILRMDAAEDKSVHTSTDLSLINSGSLKNVLAVLNQSANLSAPKDGDPVQALDALPAINISFPVSDDAGMAETPTMTNSTSMAPFEELQRQINDSQDHLPPVEDVLQYGKRRALELTLEDQSCKRMKGSEHLKPCAY